MRYAIAIAAALTMTPVVAVGQGYLSYDGTYRPNNPAVEYREQEQIDRLNRGELRYQDRVDEREYREQAEVQRDRERWQREYEDYRQRDRQVQEWNNYGRFRRGFDPSS